MPKDHEKLNSRRTHTLMSMEDIVAGKKSSWYELEITGTVRNLCPSLWRLEHLTSLYLNDNNLMRIPPDISRLGHLHHLDLSSNKIRSLPAEIGDLIFLRELLLNYNQLRVLPFELGRLFNIVNLGLLGNPLNPEMMMKYNEGTQKLLAYLLDSLAGGSGIGIRSLFSAGVTDTAEGNLGPNLISIDDHLQRYRPLPQFSNCRSR